MSKKVEMSGAVDATTNIQRVPLSKLESIWQDTGNNLEWNCLFTLPPWLKAWWSVFGSGDELHALVINDTEGLIGVMPLRFQGPKATLIGSPDVCDYLDLVALPGRRGDVARPVFEYLAKRGIRELSLTGIKKDAVVWSEVIPYARNQGWNVRWDLEDVTSEMVLPKTWDAFLQQLSGKQRHELRRKLRRLHEAGEVRYRMIEPTTEVGGAVDLFLELFRASRPDKAAFMTKPMTRFFRALAVSFSQYRMAKFGMLELSGKPVSMVMCFDYRSTRYLYNSGYNPKFRGLSVGLISKILGIRDAVEKGISRFDFLKGAEIYKTRLGGVSKDIYRCSVHLP